MGIKFLSLHMIPWCFHLRVLGSNLSNLQQQRHRLQPEESVEASSIKLIKLDGLVKIYHQPIHVSQLMLEFPKHLVCHSDSFYIGQKIPALSEDDQLLPGHKYFLLPKHFFQSVLSFVTIASFASSPYPTNSYSSKQASLKKAAAAATCQPFDIRRTPSGSLQIRVSDAFISKLMEEGKTKEENENGDPSKAKVGVCTTPQLHKDYMQLVGSRQWKPKLETIRESERRKLSNFGMKRRKKSQSQSLCQSRRDSFQNSRIPEEQHPRTPTTTTPKTTFKFRLQS